ncbi:MAG: phosphoglyceromutase, partial [Bacteroidota bacterium]
QPQVLSPWSTVRLDAFTHHYALEYIKKKKPRLVYISYGETDDFAHDGDYEAYLKSAHQTDAFIKELWQFVQSNRRYRNKTTFLITTDHGRGYKTKADWKSHGKTYYGSNEIWMAAIGPDTLALGERAVEEKTLQSQIAKTIAQLLGHEYSNDAFEVGEVLPNIIK